MSPDLVTDLAPGTAATASSAADEAARFACNVIVLDREIILPENCPKLCSLLAERGCRPHAVPMTEFMKAGGACKCLALFLPQRDEHPRSAPH